MIRGSGKNAIGRYGSALCYPERGGDVQIVDDGRNSGSLLNLCQNAAALFCALHRADDGDGAIVNHEVNRDVAIWLNPKRCFNALADGSQEDSITGSDGLVAKDNIAVDVGSGIDKSIRQRIDGRGYCRAVASARETISARKAVRGTGHIVVREDGLRAVARNGSIGECLRLRYSGSRRGRIGCCRAGRGPDRDGGGSSAGGFSRDSGLSHNSRGTQQQCRNEGGV